MKNIILMLLMLAFGTLAQAQIDKTDLALKVSKADDANLQKLKKYIWKRQSVVSINGQVKLTAISEFKFDEKGELKADVVDTESTVKQKPGLRGAAQKNAAEDKMNYVEQSLKIALAYTFMTKGQLIDFFDKATIVQNGDVYTVTGENVYVKGDKLVVLIDAKTNLFIKKTFSSFVDKDALSGEILYDTFKDGTSHGSTTTLTMPAQSMTIVAKNQDYTIRVE
jgi:hypothetical protein